jgi:hypothetical protein
MESKGHVLVLAVLFAAAICICIAFPFRPTQNHIFLVMLCVLASVLVVMLLLFANRISPQTVDAAV